MNSIFNIMIQKSIPYALVILLAYTISTFIFIFLPKNGIDFQEDRSKSFSYKNYNGYYSKIKTTNIKVDKENRGKNLISLSKYKLKAIYSTISNSGWAVIEDGSKSVIVEYNQEFAGYRLTKLFKNYIIFEKNSKEYKLELPKDKDVKYEIKQNTVNGIESIVVKEDNIQIKRKYIDSYVENIDKVWKDINIKDIRKNGRIEGFKIYSVNKNSVFGKLGLKQNDVIKSVNGTEIRSYADAFKIYNEIKKLEYLSLEVLRNNEIVELDYEIN